MKKNFTAIFLITIFIFGSVSLLIDEVDWLRDLTNSNHKSPRKSVSSIIHKKNLKPSKIESKNQFNSEQLNKLWKNDFINLLRQGEIPTAWTLISEIQAIPTDAFTLLISKNLKPPLKINKNGIYKLELTIISHPNDNGNPSVILQHNIVNKENENTIWEMNRIYQL